MATPGGSKGNDTKPKLTSSSLGISKTIKKSRTKDIDTKHVADAVKEEVAKEEGNTTPVEVMKKDYSAEYDVKHPTDDKMRNKVRGLLQKALCVENANAEGAAEVAAAIENAMYNKFGGNGPPYKNKYRTLSFNFKDLKNKNLRESVLHRQLPPSELIQMSSEDLANDDLKKDREKVLEKLTKDAQPFNNPAASTDQFKCGKCKERKCTYYQMQTRSADEPLTTFVQCVVPGCGNRWRF